MNMLNGTIVEVCLLSIIHQYTFSSKAFPLSHFPLIPVSLPLATTGSADKTIKIWGLDFGDCHRSLHAHEDSVSCLRFQPSTHYFFSAGKDGVIKYWDADRYVLYCTTQICTYTLIYTLI